MGGGASKSVKYVPEPEADIDKIEITTPASVHFYGKSKPLDKFGKDSGLKEVYAGWKFPDSDDKSVVINPYFTDGVHGDWSQKRFDDAYDERLSQHGMTPADLQKIRDSLEKILGAFYPFQRDRKLEKKTMFSERGWNAATKGIDVCGTNKFYYAIQMRKILAKAGRDFPTTFWSLHIHKSAGILGGEGMFVERVWHSIKIELAPSVPGWWDYKQLGAGSHWHVWRGDVDGESKRPALKSLPAVTTADTPKGQEGASPTSNSPIKGPDAAVVEKVDTEEAEARRAKRKGSAADTFSGLEQFAAKNGGK